MTGLFTFAQTWSGTDQLHRTYANGSPNSTTATETTFNTLLGQNNFKIGLDSGGGNEFFGWVFLIMFEPKLTDDQILALHNSVSAP